MEVSVKVIRLGQEGGDRGKKLKDANKSRCEGNMATLEPKSETGKKKKKNREEL